MYPTLLSRNYRNSSRRFPAALYGKCARTVSATFNSRRTLLFFFEIVEFFLEAALG
jgi:hypothetical protein